MKFDIRSAKIFSIVIGLFLLVFYLSNIQFALFVLHEFSYIPFIPSMIALVLGCFFEFKNKNSIGFLGPFLLIALILNLQLPQTFHELSTVVTIMTGIFALILSFIA